ncbi:hypothetical protein OSTOST_14792, partial [Ostertagia ostertagi]
AEVSTAVGQPTPQTTECVTAKEEGPPGVTTARTTSEKTTEIGEECTPANQPTPKVENKVLMHYLQDEGCRTASEPTPRADEGCTTARVLTPKADDGCRTASEPTPTAMYRTAVQPTPTPAEVSTAVGQPTPQTTECVTAKEEGPPGVTTARTTSEKTTEIVTKRTTEKFISGEECTPANQPTPKVESEGSRTAVQPTPKAVRFFALVTSRSIIFIT